MNIFRKGYVEVGVPENNEEEGKNHNLKGKNTEYLFRYTFGKYEESKAVLEIINTYCNFLKRTSRDRILDECRMNSKTWIIWKI